MTIFFGPSFMKLEALFLIRSIPLFLKLPIECFKFQKFAQTQQIEL